MPTFLDLPALRAAVADALDALDALDAIDALDATRKPPPQGQKKKKKCAHPFPDPDLVDVVATVIDQVLASRTLRDSDLQSPRKRSPGRVFWVRGCDARGDDGAPSPAACLEAAGIAGRLGDSPAAAGHFGKVYRLSPSLPSAKGRGALAVKVVRLDWGGTLEAGLRSWKAEAEHAVAAGELGVGPRVRDAFVCAAGSAGSPIGVLVSDFVEGVSLATWRKQAPTPSAAVRAAVEREVAAKVRRLHAAGILHGDLHAGNVLVRTARPPKGVGRSGQSGQSGRSGRSGRSGQSGGRVMIVDYGFAGTVEQMRLRDLRDVAPDGLVDGRMPAVDADGERWRKAQRVAGMLLRSRAALSGPPVA